MTAELMPWDQYDRWWMDNTDDEGELLGTLPEPVATLAAHVQALQGRVDELPGDLRCCCAYDHPEMVCMVHK